jgi:putative nucleotidyltransferase with HDIG domain
MNSLSRSEAFEKIFAGQIAEENGFNEIPTALFVEKMDVGIAALPNAAFYIRKGLGQFELLKEEGQGCSLMVLSVQPSVWIKASDLAEIQSFAEQELKRASTDQSISPTQRAHLLQRTAIKSVENLFASPSPENVKRSEKVVGSFVYVLMKEPKSYLLLTTLSSHDPYTLRHSVGTSVNAIILGRKIGMTDEQELTELGLAGLLHDIGKVKVKREIINKNGPLDELEWEEMRQHAQAGYDIVKDNPNLPERVKLAIWEHHEDRNGTGYPRKMKIEDTHLFSRIVSICDIFNALTTDRTYSKAKTPFEAFQLMRDKLSHKFDESLFRQLVEIYGGKI